ELGEDQLVVAEGEVLRHRLDERLVGKTDVLLAAPVQDDPARLLHLCRQLGAESRLADAGLARQGGRPRRSSAHLGPELPQASKLRLAAHEGLLGPAERAW